MSSASPSPSPLPTEAEIRALEAGVAGLEAQRATLGDAVVDAALAGLRARLAALRTAQGAGSAAAPARSLKQVSMLFMDVVGSTTLSQHLDPEETGALMDSVMQRGTALVAAHGGRVVQYADDSLLGVFGLEEAAEDDAERAVRCGLRLVALGRQLGAEVLGAHGLAGCDVGVGIHTSGVLVGGGGGGATDEGAVRGLAVNIAARMEQSAPAGGLRISQDTWSQVQGLFEFSPPEVLQVKGVDTPIVSHVVHKPLPQPSRRGARGIEGVPTRMIGREVELQALQAAFQRLMVAESRTGTAGPRRTRPGLTRVLARPFGMLMCSMMVAAELPISSQWWPTGLGRVPMSTSGSFLASRPVQVESRSLSLDQRRSSCLPLTAIASARFWPTRTTKRLPRVMPV